MKKIIVFSLALVLISAAASAQTRSDRFRKHRISQGFSNGQLTRPERFQLHRDVIRYNRTERNARRDGMVGPLERKKLYKMRTKTRRDSFRFHHNGRRRVI